MEAVEDELGRAAADVDEQRRGAELADAALRQLGLLVAREQLRREAVAPLDLAEERLAVLRVADRARGDEQRPLGAERLGGAAIVGEDVANARDRKGEEATARVDAFAEARDPRLAVQLLDAAVLDAPDEQARRVRARGLRPRRSLVGEVGGDSPDGTVRLVERRAQDGELRERDAQALEALLQLGRRLARGCDPRLTASALRRELVEPAQDVPARVVRRRATLVARAPRTARKPRFPRTTTTMSAAQMAQSHIGTMRNEGATIGPRRGVEQSGSSPGS